MATKTRAQMIDHVLQRISVLAAGQSATADDSALVGPILDSLHDTLRARGLAPFATSAFPMWAQEAFTKILSSEIAPYFGVQPSVSDVRDGESELRRQLKTHNRGNPVNAKYY